MNALRRVASTGGWQKPLLALLLAAAGSLLVWDRANIKDEIERLRTEDQALRSLIRQHATGDGLGHMDFKERFRALERAVFGKGE